MISKAGELRSIAELHFPVEVEARGVIVTEPAASVPNADTRRLTFWESCRHDAFPLNVRMLLTPKRNSPREKKDKLNWSLLIVFEI
jgi:hypothetical protein